MSIHKPNIQHLKTRASLFQGSLRGVERECLRVDADASLAVTPHPSGLGSALTHPNITTDFSESLVEFITAPHASIEAMLEQLQYIHCFSVQHLADELFWASSMPSLLPDDSDIPIAQFGHSNSGTMKSVYRKGLSKRYGSSMQMVSGIHYNYSLAPAIWSELRWNEQSFLSLQDYTNQGYFRIIRNFKRWYWLLIYLFGAAPVVNEAFIRNKKYQLEPLSAIDDTYCHRYGTSLRLGALGYQSSVQDELSVSYNNLTDYINDLLVALNQPFPAYQGFSHNQSDWQQLSAAILQIENEFYSVIRPKQTTRSGETQLKALWNRGIEYIEVRCLDINPFEPLGINAQQAAFIETFILTCLLTPSPDLCDSEAVWTLDNQKQVVTNGRQANIDLTRKATDGSAEPIGLVQWADELFESMAEVAKLLDSNYQTEIYSQSLDAYKPLVDKVDLTLSSQVVQALQQTGNSYIDWTLQQSKQFTQQFKEQLLNADTQSYFDSLTIKSIDKQRSIERQDNQSFTAFINDYYQQYQPYNFQ